MPDSPTLKQWQNLMPSMNPSERAQLQALLLKGKAPPLWSPDPANLPQTLAFNSAANVIGYGGAAGGGKTDLGFGLALASAHRKTLFMRREFSQLRGIIDRSHGIIGQRGRFNENLHVWRGLPEGRVLEFGGCSVMGSEVAFQGRPHDLLFFDEANQFAERQVRFLMAWNRTTVKGLRAQTVMAFNPPTDTNGEWLLAYFDRWLGDNPAAQPGELRWFTMIDGKEIEVETGAPFIHNGETITPLSRTFFPARVKDNPHWQGTGYEAQLQALEEPLRSMMLLGLMTAGKKDDAWQLISTANIRAAQERWKTMAEPDLPLVLGVDVARGGKDKTVLARRRGEWIAPLEKHDGSDTDTGGKVAALAMQALSGGGYANVDVIGVGASAYDFMNDAKLPCEAINFAAASSATDRTGKFGFQNLRAEAYWNLRQALDPEGPTPLALPPDPELAAELAAIRWAIGLRGIKIEDKDEVKKRLGRSPDCADAVALAVIMTAAPFDPEAFARGLQAMEDAS